VTLTGSSVALLFLKVSSVRLLPAVGTGVTRLFGLCVCRG